MIAILDPFFVGCGPREIEGIANPFESLIGHNIHRHCSLYTDAVGTTINTVTRKEMHLAMAEEIKETTICDKGIEFYKKWIDLPPKDCGPIGLILSYDMGLQRYSSGHAYKIMPGHTFVIESLTNRITDCVV